MDYVNLVKLEIINCSRKSSFTNSYTAHCINRIRAQSREQAEGTRSRRHGMQIMQGTASGWTESTAPGATAAQRRIRSRSGSAARSPGRGSGKINGALRLRSRVTHPENMLAPAPSCHGAYTPLPGGPTPTPTPRGAGSEGGTPKIFLARSAYLRTPAQSHRRTKNFQVIPVKLTVPVS